LLRTLGYLYSIKFLSDPGKGAETKLKIIVLVYHEGQRTCFIVKKASISLFYASSFLFKNLEIIKLPTTRAVITTDKKSPRKVKNEVYDGSPELKRSPNIIIVQFKLII
jgi:hypothetical protein